MQNYILQCKNDEKAGFLNKICANQNNTQPFSAFILTMNDSGDNIQFDVFDDCIFLMDEHQYAANREAMQANLGILEQHEWVLLMLPTSGCADVEIGSKRIACREGQVAICVLNEGIVLREISDDFAARTIGMNLEFTSSLNISDTLGSNLAVHRNPVVDIDNQTRASILLIFDLLRGIIGAEDNPYRFRAVQLAVELFYHTIGYYLHHDTDTLRRTGGESLTEQFLHMLRHDFKQHRDLDHYATALYVSKKHLSSTISHTTHMTATYWIEHHVIMQAKQLLEHSTLTIGQIADELHFANQSHFGTYFKRATGQTPKKFRQATHATKPRTKLPPL